MTKTDDLSSISAADSQMLWFSTITFKALDDIKESLQEMVMLPLRCPDVLIFSKEEVFGSPAKEFFYSGHLKPERQFLLRYSK
jgi:hypothetical protein